MPNTSTPIYLDWSFWAVLVSLVAIILSQLPPVHLWFRRAKLDLELYSRIHITHKVGNPNLQLHIIISNIGGRTIRVKDIKVTIRRDGSDVAILPAQNYLQNPNHKNSVLLTSFSLKPKDEWAHIVNFLNYFSREDEKRFRSADARLREDIIEKKKLPENNDRLVEAESELVSPFLTMFSQKFVWLPGEYQLFISVISSDNSASIEKQYRFTLFESDSEALSKVTGEYKFGDGINRDSGNFTGVLVQISEA